MYIFYMCFYLLSVSFKQQNLIVLNIKKLARCLHFFHSNHLIFYLTNFSSIFEYKKGRHRRPVSMYQFELICPRFDGHLLT